MRYLIFILPLLIMGCANDTQRANEESEIDGRVEHASKAQMRSITSMLDNESLGIREALAVPSEYHERAYWVSTYLIGDGLEGDPVAVWLVTGPKDQPGMIMAADGLATQMSVGPSARETRAWSNEMLTVVRQIREETEGRF